MDVSMKLSRGWEGVVVTPCSHAVCQSKSVVTKVEESACIRW